MRTPPLLAVLVFAAVCRAVVSQTYLTVYCNESGNYTAFGNYQNNLNRLLLQRLYFDGGISGFNETTLGEPPDMVYGLFLCRGDVSVDACQNCMSNATTEILNLCPGNMEAIIWYDECLVRYSNRSFFSVMESSPSFILYNVVNATNPGGFGAAIAEAFRNVTEAAISSSNLYATLNSSWMLTTLFTLVQCTPDLSKSDCRSCLNVAVMILGTITDVKIGGRVLLPSCNVRYETYGFVNSGAPAVPSPSLTNGTTGNTSASKGRLAVGWIVMVAVAGVFLTMIAVGSCIYRRQHKRNRDGRTSSEVQLLNLGNGLGGHTSNDDLQGENPLSSQETLMMRLSVICAATDDFSEENKLGQGGFGPVYKGVLADGKEIAVKRLSRASGQGLIELKNEVVLIARLQHRNLVRLLGFCLEQHEMMLVYEYMPNKSLDFFLFDQSRSGSLDWKKRFSIISGIARGLLYLHEDSRLRIIHRDLKASNILLDHEMNPKISDFGMARIFGVNQDEASTNRVVGT
ncbi:hypothetical protein MLD38_037184 [Melastoma candidum]|uniref:Uncharacterized protein n=1 Tax=Melastoma candidum TaxID=119954 RepID=A0ACB9LN14_9MYRT|nr:hypothetical protein MLD38_037184 [Melastoma candidum]